MNYIKMWYVKNLHISLNNKELKENSVCSFFEHTAKDVKNYHVKSKSIDVIKIRNLVKS